jgi:hypothetical protein
MGLFRRNRPVLLTLDEDDPRTVSNCWCLRQAADGVRLRDDFAAAPPCRYCQAPGRRQQEPRRLADNDTLRQSQYGDWDVKTGRQPDGSYVGKHRGGPSWHRSSPGGHRAPAVHSEDGGRHVWINDPEDGASIHDEPDDDDDPLAELRRKCYLAAALMTALGDSLVPRRDGGRHG